MATGLIAEDEPLLAMALKAELRKLWPALQVVAEVGDGQSAIERALVLKPQVLFLDIRMPVMTGLDAALELVDAWPDADSFPAIVFVTAYDDYALQAFEARAIDYLVKPVQSGRLASTVQRLQQRLSPASGLEDSLAQLRSLLQSGLPGAAAGHRTEPAATVSSAAPLRILQAGVGQQIRMIPIDEVCYFEAADKYVRVVTADGKDWLIRTPLKELIAQLDPALFWQVHRGTIVRAAAIEAVLRDEAGRQRLKLRGQRETLAVSRLYAQQFKAM